MKAVISHGRQQSSIEPTMSRFPPQPEDTVEEDELAKDHAGRPIALIVAAIVVPIILIFGVWYLATQTDELVDEEPPAITVESPGE
jgi:hypothetical protein